MIKRIFFINLIVFSFFISNSKCVFANFSRDCERVFKNLDIAQKHVDEILGAEGGVKIHGISSFHELDPLIFDRRTELRFVPSLLKIARGIAGKHNVSTVTNVSQKGTPVLKEWAQTVLRVFDLWYPTIIFCSVSSEGQDLNLPVFWYPRVESRSISEDSNITHVPWFIFDVNLLLQPNYENPAAVSLPGAIAEGIFQHSTIKLLYYWLQANMYSPGGPSELFMKYVDLAEGSPRINQEFVKFILTLRTLVFRYRFIMYTMEQNQNSLQEAIVKIFYRNVGYDQILRDFRFPTSDLARGFGYHNIVAQMISHVEGFGHNDLLNVIKEEARPYVVAEMQHQASMLRQKGPSR